MKKIIVLVGTFVFFLSISAYGKSLNPHVHGIGYMDITIVNQDLLVELKSPAYNILGFGKPKSKKEKKIYGKALLALKNINLIPKSAKCKTQKIDAFSDEEEEHHDEHDEKHGDEHKKDNHEKHGEHEEEDHGEHEEEPSHFDIKAYYSYKCKNIKNISFIDAQIFFKKFKNLKEIQVQWIKDNTQGSNSLNAKNTKIKF